MTIVFSARFFYFISYESSITFVKLASGVFPTNKVYENERVFAFLDLNPQSEGHVLVIPKFHGQKLKDIPDEFLQDIPVVIKKVCLSEVTCVYFFVRFLSQLKR